MTISIPPFNNVPDPGSPLASAWAQQLTQYAVDLAAQLAPMGMIARIAATSDFVVTAAMSTTDIPGVSVTWVADVTRSYLITLQVGAADQTVAQGTQAASITDASNASRRSGSYVVPVAGRASYHLSYIESAISGSTTRKARFFVNAGTTTLIGTVGAYATQLSVVDIGKAL